LSGPRPTRRAWWAALALAAAAAAPGQAPPGPAPPVPAGPPPTVLGLIEQLEKAWKTRDVQAYLRLWQFTSEEARQEESLFATDRLKEEETLLEVQRPREPGPGDAATLYARAFGVAEPRARVEQWRLRLARSKTGWAITAREALPGVDGLVHLSLDPQPYRAEGLSLRLEDFEVTLHNGAVFTSPPNLGPTAIVFVGRATVKVQPRPETERQQLRQFCGAPQLVDEVRSVFMRLHPADLHRVLVPARLDPQASGAAAFAEAERFYRDHSSRSFLLDAALPRSPWWLLPGLGDSSVTFRTRRNGTLTYTLSTNDAEGISLFDRARRRQILLYPQQGRSTRYDEDDTRAVDVLDHQLTARLDPAAGTIVGEDVLRMRLVAGVSSIRLRLNGELRVESITSEEGGEHLFFRVRGQDAVMVSLGPLAGLIGETRLTVRYAGPYRPTSIEREAMQIRGDQSSDVREEEAVVVEPVTVLTNQFPWYPQSGTDDYATATIRLDVPQGYTALTGGTRQATIQAGSRARYEYRLGQPGKYFSVALGRLNEVGLRKVGGSTLEAWSVGRTRGEAVKLLEQAGDMVAFYETLFGPCPFPVLRLALFEERTPGGHSPPGMILLAQRPVFRTRNLRDDPASFQDMPGFFFAHELAHQWWGHGVAGQNYRERWLSEAFAQYAAALWIQHRMGENAFQEVLTRFQRWALAKNDEGPIHLGYRLGHIKQDPQVYRAIVYDKGAYVLHMLRSIVGHEAFATGLRDFQARHRFAKAGTDDLREALEKASGRDLAPYFQQWVFETKLPRLAVRSALPGGGPPYRATVEVEASSLPGPVPLMLSVEHARGRATRSVTLEPAGGRFVVEAPAPPRRVDVNEDRGLLAHIQRR
jgi:Peptidase family M1 domain